MYLANLDDKIIKPVSITAALLVFLIGTSVFYSRYAYIENGHGYIYALFVAASAGVFLSIRARKMALILLSLVIAFTSVSYANKKFDWREAYITSAQNGQPFFLEELIDTYPTYEEHTFTMLGAPDWVRFNDQCVQPALNGKQVSPRCASADLITRWYNINIMDALYNHFQKMRTTAKQIQDGTMKTSADYANCIATKGCASVPMLPKGVDATQIAPTSRDYIGIRQAFWSLVNEDKMSQQVCALTPLCVALVNMKVISPDKMPF